MVLFDTSQIKKEVICVGPYLVPFLKTACLYFIINPEIGTIAHAVIKLLPLSFLITFVWAQGLRENKYNQWIMAGLSACALGDLLLVWQEAHDAFFLAGMACFGIGQIAYTVGFGLKPFGLKELALSSLVTGIIVHFISSCLSQPLSTIVPIYAMLLSFTAWRALARFNLNGDIPWRKIYAAAGAILFAFSDTVLAVNKFCTPLPYETPLIMISYYGAQMFITFSIINSRLTISQDKTTTSSKNNNNNNNALIKTSIDSC
ncbi:PREDICTED: lysoplasmalogenase-like protein TMEM86A [Amphimedon queenslandica]|uniref:lysoplasmalogenase n=1 Tax=Amphimedon queenslandica TaxID=400682 RepID=A0A1X7VDL1_AMPQE|nr:PREDICTED: lysoplasmalogenase-like protein TMEM86A [Amphimedon queenslandica]|eukprot:XP_003384894.1 PREDICTED: lysoplasmalogenase-like protein TMEM86A [Amphimedon queenslandica]